MEIFRSPKLTSKTTIHTGTESSFPVKPRTESSFPVKPRTESSFPVKPLNLS